MCVELGDPDLAAELLPTLESYGDTVVSFWAGLTVLGPTALYRGGVRAVLGERDAARADLQRAVEVSERLGAQPFLDRARRLLEAQLP